MPLSLEAIKNGKVIPLDKAVLLFGRHPDCDVVLSQSAKISRKHCCIMQVNATCVIRDLGSTNGIHLNGKRVKRLATLKKGDQLAIGDVMFKVNTYNKPSPVNGSKQAKSQDSPSAAHDSQAHQPAAHDDPPSGEVTPQKGIPRQDTNSPLNISQELPVAISEDEEEIFPNNQEPKFRAVVDAGLPLSDEDEAAYESSADSQLDVILLEPADDDDDE